MAKINASLTAAENILAIANALNPDLNATAENVTLGLPTVSAGTGGRNTAITLTAIANQGLSGSQTFAYTRLALAAGQAIATAKAIPVVIAPADTDAEVLTKVATALGLIESQVALSNIVRPVDEDTNGSADVGVVANSLLYTGTYAVTLTVPDTDVPMDEAAPVTDLDGFDPEG